MSIKNKIHKRIHNIHLYMKINGPYFFDRSNNNMKKILREQRNTTCEEAICDGAINSAIIGFNYGYAILSKNSNKNEKNKYILNAFILFHIKYTRNINFQYVFIEMISSNIDHRKNLLDLCIQYCKKFEITYVYLYISNAPETVAWYENFGFTTKQIFSKNNQIQACSAELCMT